MFFRFENRLTVSANLVAATAIRIGAGKDTDVCAPDLPVVRGAGGAPYVPGSSLKGVIRAYLESLVRGVAGNAAACDPTDLNRTCIRSGRPGHDRATQPSTTYFKDLADKYRHNDQKLAEAVEQNSCLICSVFGSQAMSSHVSFFDAPAQSWFGQFQVRNGVAIDRDSGKAADRKLYDFEVVPAGTHFKFRTVLENSSEWMRGMIVVALESLKAGSLTVGGARSRGLGLVDLSDLTYNFVATPMDLLDCLDNGSSLAGPVTGPSDLQEWTQQFRSKLQEVSNAQAARQRG